MNENETFCWKNAMKHFADGKKIQYNRGCIWSPCEIHHGSMTFHKEFTYRLTPERKKIPLCKEDWDGQSVIWVKDSKGIEKLIIEIGQYHSISSYEFEFNFSFLMEKEYQYSFNRKDWFDCFKYEGEG